MRRKHILVKEAGGKDALALWPRPWNDGDPSTLRVNLRPCKALFSIDMFGR